MGSRDIFAVEVSNILNFTNFCITIWEIRKRWTYDKDNNIRDDVYDGRDFFFC